MFILPPESKIPEMLEKTKAVAPAEGEDVPKTEGEDVPKTEGEDVPKTEVVKESPKTETSAEVVKEDKPSNRLIIVSLSVNTPNYQI